MTERQETVFRLTPKRKKIISDILQMIQHGIERIDERSLSRMFIVENETLSKEKKESRLAALDKELKTLNLYHDVLRMVACHSEEWLRRNFMKEEREWETEWDIPLLAFNDSIDGIIEYIKQYKETNQAVSIETYAEKIYFLLLLKEYRKQRK